VELPLVVDLRMAGNGPPRVAQAVSGGGKDTHDEVLELVACAELELERPIAALIGVVEVGFEQFDQRPAEHVGRSERERVCRARRHVDEPSIPVGRPYPADPGLLEVIKQGEARGGITRRYDCRRIGAGRRPRLRFAPEKTRQFHCFRRLVRTGAPILARQQVHRTVCLP
jgi:hypothetical protein